MKALWYGEMSSCIFGASRSARILLMIFASVNEADWSEVRNRVCPILFGIRMMFTLCYQVEVHTAPHVEVVDSRK
jgi:hypothetical protein